METQYLMRAVMALMGTDLPVVVCPSEDYDEIHWCDVPEEDRPDKDAVVAEINRLRDADATIAYRNLRALSYPAIGDQLDALFHAGVFPQEMHDKLQAVKDQFPKPEQ